MKRVFIILGVLPLLIACLTSCQGTEGSHALEIRFLDVGQGDCTLLRTPFGNVLVDAGPESEQELLMARLHALGVNALELLIVTHPDEDHMGGADGVLRALSVKEVWTNGYEDTHETALTFRDALMSSNATHKAVKAGEKYTLGEMTLFVYAPFAAEDAAKGNEGSIVFRLVCGNSVAIFTGDAEADTEERLLSAYGRDGLNCDLYKVGHHGSSTSTGEAFLSALSPKYAVICCGKENTFGHPHGAVLDRLDRIGALILRTDLDGELCFVTDGEEFSLQYASRPERILGIGAFERRKELWQIY